MLPGSELALEVGGYATAVAALGHLLTSIDRWAHSPARLQGDIDTINKRLDQGNDRYSLGIGRVNVKLEQIDSHLNAVDMRVTRLEAFHEADFDRRRKPRGQ